MRNLLQPPHARWTIALALGITTIWLPPSVNASETRSTEAINADIRQQFDAIQDVLPTAVMLSDADQRKAAAPKAIPLFKKLIADFDELEIADPASKEQVVSARAEYSMFLALMGDPDSVNRLKTEAVSADPVVSVQGQSGQLMIAWLNASKDESAETKIVDDIEKLARQHPDSSDLTVQILEMSQMGSPPKPLVDRLQAIITDVMSNAAATQMKAEIQSSHKLGLLESKPLTISGKQLDGKNFTTADWKGKVILVDFWATWCGPCMQEMPRVQKLYAENHDKGLEVLGVSNDMSADDLSKFRADNKGAPWPQLFDPVAAQQQQWNPITQGFGINGIPTMFLIDKKGVCRSVTARENMEDLIPKLLAE